MSDLVNFKLAHKLKEKGFDMPCTYAYCKKGGWNMYTRKHEPIAYILRTDGNPFGTFYSGKNWNVEYKTNKNKICCSAPTISQVLKWLREEKNIFIEIFLYNGKYSHFIKSVTQICKDDLFHECLDEDTEEEYATYEQAALAGIEYSLDNLI